MGVDGAGTEYIHTFTKEEQEHSFAKPSFWNRICTNSSTCRTVPACWKSAVASGRNSACFSANILFCA